ncbi:MAG: hypothetical protein HKM89_01515 [Gemmatimonadales bacterium]|nr:hypothetical protein [Gemmatimonadales bacterium]
MNQVIRLAPRRAFVLTLLSVAFAAAAGAQEAPVGMVVSIGPTESIVEQLQYLDEHWPQQHAVGVVEAVEVPECSTREDGGPRYCWLRARPVELIHVRWLRRDPPGPGADFRLHYWYRPGAAELEIGQGSQLMTFLVPGRFPRGVFVATVLMRNTEEISKFVRQALSDPSP